MFRPDIGYVQGMNYLAGNLLLHTRGRKTAEEDAFWLLTRLLTSNKYAC